VIADPDRRNTCADLFDNSRALVTENDRQSMYLVAGNEVKITVTYTRCSNFDKHFPCLGPGKSQILNLEWFTDCAKYCRSHPAIIGEPGVAGKPL
jgi:hypothetical protein